MLLKFNLFKINEDSKLFRLLKKYDKTNEFIVVGKEIIDRKEYLKVHQLGKKGLCLLGGFKLDECAYSIPKDEIKPYGDGIGIDYVEMKIDKKYLSVDLIETIQNLNS